jgi:malate dehydrogenase
MSKVAIIGAGPIGTAVAHRLAAGSRFGDIVLIDQRVDVARGKALDIQQSGPVDHFDTRLSGDADPIAAIGAAAIVIADAVEDGEWREANGKALLQQLASAGNTAPIVFAGPHQTELMETAFRDLKMPASRLVGSASAGLVAALKSLVGIELNTTGVDLTVVGRPPQFVIVWSSATTSGSLVGDRLSAHRLLAISESITRLWPPGPGTLGAAAATVAEAIVDGRRSLIAAATIVDGALGARGTAMVLPLELGQGRVLGHVLPMLSPQEKSKLGS